MAVLRPIFFGSRSIRVIFGLAALCAAASAAPSAMAQDRLDLAVKAAYLYKLAPFVDWPSGGAGAFELCVVGDDPFGAILDRAVSGQQVAGQPIVVRRMPSADRNAPCRMMFLAGSAQQSVKDALRLLRAAPILTVTDAQTPGGMVNFVIDQGRVRFRIDDQAAAESGMSFSSKLLNLAVSVTPRKTRGMGR